MDQMSNLSSKLPVPPRTHPLTLTPDFDCEMTIHLVLALHFLSNNQNITWSNTSQSPYKRQNIFLRAAEIKNSDWRLKTCP